MDSGSSSYTTFILRMDTQTPGWEKALIKVLKGIPGVTFSIDANGLARVSGNIDPGKTLKLLAKAGKHAQLYSIFSGTKQPASERRDDDDDHHHPHRFNDPHERYWHANHQYYHQPYPFPPPQHLPQPPPLLPAEHLFARDSQCMIM